MYDLAHFFRTSFSLTWQWVTWVFKFLNWSLATFQKWIAFKGLCSTHRIIKKGFLKHFPSFKLFCRGWNKTWCTFCSWSMPFHLATLIANTLNTTHLNITSTKMQHCYSIIHHTNSQQINTERLSTMQSHCIWLALHATSPETFGLRLMYALSLNTHHIKMF
jgi:hypothetical protein